MILDEIESYQLHIKKGRLVFHLLIVSYFYYRIPFNLYKKWQLDPFSGWVLFYVLISILLIFSSIRLIKMLFSNDFILEMTEKGMRTKEFGFIDWEQIDTLKVNKSGLNNTTLLIFLKNPDSFMQTLNVSNFKKQVMDTFNKDNGTPFFISISETNYKKDLFDAALLRYKSTPSVSV